MPAKRPQTVPITGHASQGPASEAADVLRNAHRRLALPQRSKYVTQLTRDLDGDTRRPTSKRGMFEFREPRRGDEERPA